MSGREGFDPDRIVIVSKDCEGNDDVENERVAIKRESETAASN